MQKAAIQLAPSSRSLPKAATGIAGLDEITGGGLPRGRTTLVCGSPGCGKTLLAMEFLVRGASEYDEPGVFVAFEETSEELAENVRSLGFDLKQLTEQKKLLVDFVHIERSEIEETGDYDLEGLFIRLGHAIDSIQARRIVLDTLETLFSGLSNAAILRAEIRRLFRWLKDRKITAVITGERGENTLTRYGLEEYVSDCVIVLDHRVTENLSTRRLRVLKYRGTTHGTNEYPFLIDEQGISVLPVTSLGLDHPATDERVSTGIPRLDGMLGGQGVYRGSSVLVSGTAGTGKTSLAAHFADAACRRGERCLYLAFEESESQVLRNLRSLGVDLGQWTKKGLLRFHASRPSGYGLEMHLLVVRKLVSEFEPQVVIIDPLTSFLGSGTAPETESMVMRLVDFLKSKQITGLFTSLIHGKAVEESEVAISSLIDTWIFLRDIELGGERNRGLYVLKSRGMAHSNQIREFLLTDHGIELTDVYVGPEGVLTGSMRQAQEAREKASALARQQEIDRRRRELDRKRLALDAHVAAQRAQLEAEEEEMKVLLDQDEAAAARLREDREAMGRSRRADEPGENRTNRARETAPRGARK
jgi:circadian clock protein KaiC